MMKETVISRSVRLIFTGGMVVGLGLMAQPVLAQEAKQDDSKLQRVEITGSSIKRIAKEGALPVQTYNRAEIEKTGATSVTDLIQRLPAMQGYTATQQSVGGGGGGLSSANLHNIGDSRTLVLLNGRRLASHGGQTLTGGLAAIDLNTIPLAAVERVEMLTDGASALYGSDAIGGVVNFILRGDFKGAEFSAGIAAPEKGARENKISVTGGFGDLANNGYNLLLSYGRDTRTSLKATDREFAKTGIMRFTEGGTPYEFFNGSPSAVPANIVVGGVLRNPYLQANGRCPTAHQQVGQACYFDFTTTVQIYPEQKRDTLLLSGQKSIGADTTLFADLTFGRSVTTAVIAPPPIAIPIPTTSPFYSYAQSVGATTNVTARWRGSDIGGRTSEYKNDAYQLAFGAKGTAWNWDYTAAYTRSESKYTETDVKGWVLRNELAAALTAGTINPFLEPGNQSAAGMTTIANIQHKGILKEGKSALDVVELKGSRSLMKLAAGEMQLGAGVDFRRESNKYMPSEVAQGITNGIAGDDSTEVGFDLSRKAYGAFAELLVPITKELEMTGSLRTDHYSDFGSTTNYKIGARWTPVSSLLVRASIGTGFRAPTVPQTGNIRQPYGVTGQTYNCPFVAPDPLAVYCPPPNAQYDVYATGNPDLKPETSQQWTFGMRFEPTSNLSVGFDWWNVKLKDRIDQLAEDTIMNDPITYRHLFTTKTDPLSGQTLLAISQANDNFGNSVTQGIDLDGRLRFSTPFGPMTTVAAGTYMIKNDYQRAKNGPYFTNLGKFNDDEVTLRFIGRLTNTLEHGSFAHTLAVNYKSGYGDQTQFDAVDNLATGVTETEFNRKVDSYTTIDWQTAYTYNKWLKLSVGVLNLLNQDPPFTIKTGGGHNLGYDGRYADPRGRTFYLTATGKF